MARRKAAGAVADGGEKTVVLDEPTTSTNGTAEEASDTSKQVAAPPTVITYDPVQINNYNITELKNTLDDALKRVRLTRKLSSNSLRV